MGNSIPLNLSQMTAAGIDLTLKIKSRDESGKEITTEKVYHLSPMSNQDIGEYELWMQTRYLDQVKSQTQDLDKETRTELLDKALQRSVEITVASEEGVRLMNSFTGMKQLVYINLRRSHPTITMDEVANLMMDSGLAKSLLEKLDMVNGGTKRNPTKAPQIKISRGKKKPKTKQKKTW